MSEFEQNLSRAKQYLTRFKEAPLGQFIGGEFYTNEKTFTNLTPVDNTSIGEVSEGTEMDMDKACEAAKKAFPAWRDMPGAERKRILHHFADKIVERADEIALVCLLYTSDAADE